MVTSEAWVLITVKLYRSRVISMIHAFFIMYLKCSSIVFLYSNQTLYITFLYSVERTSFVDNEANVHNELHIYSNLLFHKGEVVRVAR